MAVARTLKRVPETRNTGDPEVDYPSSDGLALQGTVAHSHAINRAWEALVRRFQTEPSVFIAPCFALYYWEGGRKRSLYPDLLVARGLAKPPRVSYRIGEQPVPQFVLEVASRSTKDRDRRFKKEQYQRLGVREYWQLDQSGDLLPRPLIGHRLIGRRYEDLRRCGMLGRVPQYPSEELGLLLRVEPGPYGLTVVFTDPRTGEDVLTGKRVDKARREEADARVAAERRAREEAEARVAAERRAQTAEDRAQAAEDLVAKYRAQLRKTGKDTPE